jgi:hypothetical protein
MDRHGTVVAMVEASSGPRDITGSLSGEEVALVLQKVICPVGLAPAALARQIDLLGPLVGMDSVQARIEGSGDEETVRAVAVVVKEAVSRLHQGVVRMAADLLLGVSRTRGLPRRDRRKAAADVLVVVRRISGSVVSFPCCARLRRRSVPSSSSAAETDPGMPARRRATSLPSVR